MVSAAEDDNRKRADKGKNQFQEKSPTGGNLMHDEENLLHDDENDDGNLLHDPVIIEDNNLNDDGVKAKETKYINLEDGELHEGILGEEGKDTVGNKEDEGGDGLLKNVEINDDDQDKLKMIEEGGKENVEAESKAHGKLSTDADKVQLNSKSGALVIYGATINPVIEESDADISSEETEQTYHNQPKSFSDTESSTMQDGGKEEDSMEGKSKTTDNLPPKQPRKKKATEGKRKHGMATRSAAASLKNSP